MKKLLATAALILAPTIALAGGNHYSNSIQYQGPVELTNLDQLINTSTRFTEKDVVVEGVLVRRINRETFIFSDGKAEVQIELDDDIHQTQPIDSNTLVRLFGEYEGGHTPEIEVDLIQVL